jgi:hypothetical protein
VSCNQTSVKGLSNVEEVKPFPAVERRRNPAVPSERREAGELAVFQELGKALTSSVGLVPRNAPVVNDRVSLT